MRPPAGRGGGRSPGGRGGFGGRSPGGGRGRGRGGYDNSAPPETVVELGTYMHACEGEAVCKLTNAKIPMFNGPVCLENKSVIGKIEEILGPINASLFTVKMAEGVQATSYTSGMKFYTDPARLLPLERFLPQPGVLVAVEEDAEVAEEVDGAVAEEGVAAAGVVWAHAVADVVVALAVARQVEDAVAVSVDAVAVSVDVVAVSADAVAVSADARQVVDVDAGDTADRAGFVCAEQIAMGKLEQQTFLKTQHSSTEHDVSPWRLLRVRLTEQHRPDRFILALVERRNAVVVRFERVRACVEQLAHDPLELEEDGVVQRRVASVGTPSVVRASIQQESCDVRVSVVCCVVYGPHFVLRSPLARQLVGVLARLECLAHAVGVSLSRVLDERVPHHDARAPPHWHDSWS
eukprot:CAMPEP_0206122996 /NCGR_PEP_ID=MMETSP1472-20131121/2464_1 /ASSEMBLY_ACC=CAM_ASM_001108 /TAXON_ID=41880 /ORGANISM="Pycnococcus provasolii, Strain RCC251" /LENGTH=405 /DNA_ID=CAMNT_0053513519 /DNA_START=126 /DNA_END=1343 /DNA_ORIENTATION=-